MSNDIVKSQDFGEIERVLVSGDLSKLTPDQRVNYYNTTCKSLGLNPLTRPFDYITLNGKLTLYARKDAAEQLRNTRGVSIDDIDVEETDTQFIVKCKGHDATGKTDVDFGVVNKSDMRGDTANAMMKAVTKAKRRFTLSICGMGFLDETEIETIKDARQVVVAETGEIVESAPVQVSGQYNLEDEYRAARETMYVTSTNSYKIGDMDLKRLEYVIEHARNEKVVTAARIVHSHKSAETQTADYAHGGMPDPRTGDGEN